MIIRPATYADAAPITRFWNPLIRETAVTFSTIEKTPEQLARDIEARDGAFFVAEQAGDLFGFASYAQFRSGPGYAHAMEHTVIVAPSAHGRGVGRQLMARLEDQAESAGVHALIAGISGENPGAVAFHERLGFVRVGTMPELGRKFGRWMDLILLQKLLGGRR